VAARLLLDTNALIWFVAGEAMEDDALFSIAAAQEEDCLFVSPISAWEAALAVQKANPARRPNLKGDDAATWFRNARRSTGARLVEVGSRIALEAARVPAVYGSGDPGDCYIIATARVRNLAIVTRDGPMTALANDQPEYIELIQC
jgi:PIN domain nuclease of toxin-antitoxin system